MSLRYSIYKVQPPAPVARSELQYPSTNRYICQDAFCKFSNFLLCCLPLSRLQPFIGQPVKFTTSSSICQDLFSFSRKFLPKPVPLAAPQRSLAYTSIQALACQAVFDFISKNTTTGEAGGCHLTGIALCSSRNASTYKYEPSTAHNCYFLPSNRLVPVIHN